MVLKSLAKRLLASRLLITVFRELRSNAQEFQYDQFRKKYNISESFRFEGSGIGFHGDGDIVAKRDSFIGNQSRIQTSKGSKVVIGENCEISHLVMIYATNNVADQDLSKANIKKSKDDIIIGNNVWIGAGVFITKGVRIGENAVIGANSVVTRDIPSHTIAAGVPAKVIKFKSYTDNTFRSRIHEEYPDSISERLK
jgi:maltose O-acetyltransferase